MCVDVKHIKIIIKNVVPSASKPARKVKHGHPAQSSPDQFNQLKPDCCCLVMQLIGHQNNLDYS